MLTWTETNTQLNSNLGRKIEGIRDSVRDPEDWEAFLSSQIRMTIPFQIRANRLSRNLSQIDLGELTGMKQAQISRLESDSDQFPNVKTLFRLAKAFRVGLVVRFVPFDEMIEWAASAGSRDLSIESYDPNARTTEVASDVVLVSDARSTDNTQYEFSGETIKLSDVRERKMTGVKIESLEGTDRFIGVAHG